MFVEKINVRPAETLRDQDRALIRAQDQIDNVWIGYGDLSERALAVDGRRESLREHHRLFRGSLDRRAARFDPRSHWAPPTKRRCKKDQRRDRARDAASETAFRPLLNHMPTPHCVSRAPVTVTSIPIGKPAVASVAGSRHLDVREDVNSSPVRPDKDRARSPPRVGCRGPAFEWTRSFA